MTDWLDGKDAEAVANQIARVLCSAVEYELATLEYMEGLARPTKHELLRHRDIAEQLVFHCYDLDVDPCGLFPKSKCPRLVEILKLMADGDTPNEAIGKVIPQNKGVKT